MLNEIPGKRPNLLRRFNYFLRKHTCCTFGWHNMEEAKLWGPENDYQIDFPIKVMVCVDCGRIKQN